AGPASSWRSYSRSFTSRAFSRVHRWPRPDNKSTRSRSACSMPIGSRNRKVLLRRLSVTTSAISPNMRSVSFSSRCGAEPERFCKQLVGPEPGLEVVRDSHDDEFVGAMHLGERGEVTADLLLRADDGAPGDAGQQFLLLRRQRL